MNYRFAFKRTCQFSALEKEQFCGLFSCVFPRTLGSAAFDRKYLCTPLGYSHHGLMFANDILVGAYNLIPYTYRCFGARVLFGLSVDTMIQEERRGGPFSLLCMATMAEEAAARDGVAFVFGFPNEKAYQPTRRLLGWADIGSLNFYALPWNIGAIDPRLGWLNIPARMWARGLLWLPRVARQRQNGFGIEKVYDTCFDRHRYDGEHSTIDLGGGAKCVYRICTEEDRVRVAFLIDVAPLTPECFKTALCHVYAATVGHADMLLYVGRLPFRPGGCFRVPSFWEPRPIRICGKILKPDLIDKRVLDVEHWNVNISNSDVR